MILPTDKCNKCRIYLYGYCDKVRALYDAQSPEHLERARQSVRDCIWQSNGLNNSTHRVSGK